MKLIFIINNTKDYMNIYDGDTLNLNLNKQL